MVTRQEVIGLIQDAAPPEAQFDFEGVHEQGGSVFGQFESPLFGPMSHRERTDWVSRNVRDPLGMSGLNVGILVPVAPGEPEW